MCFMPSTSVKVSFWYGSLFLISRSGLSKKKKKKKKKIPILIGKWEKCDYYFILNGAEIRAPRERQKIPCNQSGSQANLLNVLTLFSSEFLKWNFPVDDLDPYYS